MNSYEQKQADRKERLEAAADRAQQQSNMTYRAAKAKADMIPFGQPILVGHHSEGRDRNFRKSISNGLRKSFELSEKAEYYARRAESVGTGGISSDDPDAIAKLQAQLAPLEAKQELMKKVNACIRKNDRAGVIALGLSEEATDKLFAGDFAKRKGFPSYALTNNNANINRIKARIAELTRHAERTDIERTGNGYTYREDTTENRVMFLFDGKPSEDVRNRLKRAGFKWSPSRGAWVRALNNAGCNVGKFLCKELDALQE